MLAAHAGFIRSAVELYLGANERREIDAGLVRAYRGRADEMLGEIEDLLGEQAWAELGSYVGTVGREKMREDCRALAIARAGE